MYHNITRIGFHDHLYALDFGYYSGTGYATKRSLKASKFIPTAAAAADAF